MSADLVRHVLDQLKAVGLRELIVCPGARNAAFIEALSDQTEFKVYWHFEERSAAFFALGRIQTTGQPVGVVTTSGTAAGELLPATMEAFYTGLPLVLITADRPRRFRGSGAPQAAEQERLFGVYAKGFDLEGDERIAFEIDGPLHLNVCLEDPRGTEAADEAKVFGSLPEFLEHVKNPLVVVGKLAAHERPAVLAFLRTLNAPVYLEALSGLRHEAGLTKLKVADRLLQRSEFDGVLRIGGVPTHRLWRDLEDSFANLPVLSVSSLPFSGLGRSSSLLHGELTNLLVASHNPAPAQGQGVPITLPRGGTIGTLPPGGGQGGGSEASRYAALETLLETEPTSEPGALRRLSQAIPEDSLVYLGNSLPVREWDLAAIYDKPFEIAASRGLNGIDGQLSTFLGHCQPGRENWAILGDLTTLYDLAGPWPFQQLEPGISATIVTINNGGGRIFERMFGNPNFLNAHGRSFDAWAWFWDLPYFQTDNPLEIPSAGPGLRMIEITPDAESTRRFWATFGEIIQ